MSVSKCSKIFARTYQSIDTVFDYKQVFQKSQDTYLFNEGVITGDLKGKNSDPENGTLVDMFGFLDAVEANLRLN